MLLGGPGSGKGTQAVRLAEHLGVPHISTGDLFRDNVERGTRLGVRAKRYIDAGELVPDDITRGMVRDRLAQPDTERGFILDGYPRTRQQAATLNGILASLGRRLGAAIHVRVSDGELRARLAARGRDDDDAHTVATRLRTFHRYHSSLVDYYREVGLLHDVDGEGEMEAVAGRVLGIFPKATGFTTI
ncbi:MAG: adenylate kinase [Actinomycetota bacterium]